MTKSETIRIESSLGHHGNEVPTKVTLEDIWNNEDIRVHMEPSYVPTPIYNDAGEVFINQVDYVTTPSQGTYKIFFVFIDRSGDIMYTTDQEIIQLPPKFDGFLARIVLPLNKQVPSSLDMSYLIDTKDIEYELLSVFSSDETSMFQDDTFRFRSIDMASYHDMVFPDMLVKYLDKKEELYKFLMGL